MFYLFFQIHFMVAEEMFYWLLAIILAGLRLMLFFHVKVCRLMPRFILSLTRTLGA